jgi:ABC-type sugar transport system ATPase subunit
MNSIFKAFPGVQALEDVSFELRKGEIHGLCGENGAGKTTLMKVLGGINIPDRGAVELHGKEIRLHTPMDAIRNRISIIYQELNLVPSLSIAENMFLGKEIKKGIWGKRPDRRRMVNAASETMVRLGIANLDCTQMVKNLSIAEQELVEIGKALLNDTEILVMDEPTAVLTPRETEALFAVIRKLVSDGLSVIYISHRLEEVTEMCDRVTVLRDGKNIAVLDNKDGTLSKEAIVSRMVGRELTDFYVRQSNVVESFSILEVRNFSRKGKFLNISFTLKKGEVLGLAGLVGAGRTEVGKAIFGLDPIDSGELYLDGRRIQNGSVGEAIKNGFGFVPEDRKKEGLVLGMCLGDNIALPNARLISRRGVLNKKMQRSLSDRFFSELAIRPNTPSRLTKDFSGGNQQKGVIAKWLAGDPRILILDEPTRGVDVGAKQEIYALISKLTADGIGIVFISSEMLEVMGICDRILVMAGGRITGQFKKSEMTQEAIMRAAADLD